MEIVLVILKQVIIMLALMFVGFAMFKTGKITLNGSKTLANLLIYVILPAVIVNGFITDRSREKIIGLFISACLAIVCLAISIVISRIIFKSNPIESFSASFSNPGFFGIPIIIAAYDKNSVFYVAAFIAFLNIAQWTYGVALITGNNKKIKVGNILFSPFMIGLAMGLIIFLTQIKLPSVITGTIDTVCNANTAVAMVLLGTYLAQSDIRKMFTTSRLYLVSVVRLIVIPAVCMCVLSIIGKGMLQLKVCIMIAAACPVGANVAVYAQLYDKDYEYAVQSVTLSTLLSVLTLPFIVWLLQ